MLAGVALSMVAGAAIGLGAYTFHYARGASYLTDDPAACGNCHVMSGHVAAWRASSHHAVAVCNDCHAPEGVTRKYFVKASNGFWHSLAFTTGEFHEPLRIKAGNRAVAEERCRGCHQDAVAMIEQHGGDEPISCIRCHDAVGHPLSD